jgi:hypothetical protein
MNTLYIDRILRLRMPNLLCPAYLKHKVEVEKQSKHSSEAVTVGCPTAAGIGNNFTMANSK